MDIIVDLNKITRSEFRAWRKDRLALEAELDGSGALDTDRDRLDAFDFERLYKKVIVEWPFGEVDLNTFQSLGFLDSMAVDEAVSTAIEAIGQKKLEP